MEEKRGKTSKARRKIEGKKKMKKLREKNKGKNEK